LIAGLPIIDKSHKTTPAGGPNYDISVTNQGILDSGI
jgi:hypothetical protein